MSNDKGQPIEFRNHRFLKDIYDDFSPVQVIRKASQVGFSTMAILKTFWAAKHRGYNIIYTLPTFGDVGQFVPSKVNSLIENNPFLVAWTKDKDSVSQKKIGKGFIYYRGTFSHKTEAEKMEAGVGIMLSADLLCMDEADRSDQAILEQYESRLEASDYRGKWYFSNPSSPRTRSQKLWEESDQKHWFVKCSHCGKWQYLDYWLNIKDGQFVCQHCGGIITDDDRIQGQWARKYKNRDISGYYISHLMCPWISARQIQKEYETKTKQYFYNFVLGLPYVGSDIIVNRDVILRNIDEEENFQTQNVMGVDVGLRKHYVLGNQQGIFKVGTTDKWEEIEQLIKLYDIETVVIDALPDLTEPRKLRDKYIGKIWLSYYKKEIRKADFVNWDIKTHTVYSDRNKLIQAGIDKLINRQIRFQMKAEELIDYIKHWGSLYKITEKDNLGIERDIWETSGEDHFVHATNYFQLALEKSGGEARVVNWEAEEKKDYSLAPNIQEIIKKNEQFNL